MAEGFVSESGLVFEVLAFRECGLCLYLGWGRSVPSALPGCVLEAAVQTGPRIRITAED